MKTLIILPLLATMALANVTVCKVNTPKGSENLVFVEKETTVDMFKDGVSLSENRDIALKKVNTKNNLKSYVSEDTGAIAIAVDHKRGSVQYVYNGNVMVFTGCKVL